MSDPDESDQSHSQLRAITTATPLYRDRYPILIRPCEDRSSSSDDTGVYFIFKPRGSRPHTSGNRHGKALRTPRIVLDIHLHRVKEFRQSAVTRSTQESRDNAWVKLQILRESTGSLANIRRSLRNSMESLGAALRSLEQLVATNRLQESVENSFKFSLSKCQLDMDVFLKKAGGGISATINMMFAAHWESNRPAAYYYCNTQYYALAAMHSRIQQLPPVLGYTWEGGNTTRIAPEIDTSSRAPLKKSTTRWPASRAETSAYDRDNVHHSDDLCALGFASSRNLPSRQRAVSMQDLPASSAGRPPATASASRTSSQAERPSYSNTTPAPGLRFIRRFLVSKARERSAYGPGQCLLLFYNAQSGRASSMTQICQLAEE
ncbi:hypothetical protein B0H13DRAFT_1893777 [Mycena leptocephala]|nr:hypothetical protein B0H13DRAFT_1893777 [Mycena leptocephala]